MAVSGDLRELYQEVILDHSRHPRHFGAPEAADRQARGNNPLCGDRVTIYLRLDGERIAEARFEAKGCAISIASASMMAELVSGLTIAEAEAVFARFRTALTAKEPPSAETLDSLDELAALVGVRDFPMRVKCATLPWHTMSAALDGSADEVRTE